LLEKEKKNQISKEEVERFQLEIVFFHSTYSLNMAKGYKGSKPKESPLSGKPKVN